MRTLFKILLPSAVIVLVTIFTVCYVTISKRTSRDSIDDSVPKAENTLVLVHVLFRHGDRVPNSPAYSKNPINDESYYPEGYGQISEKGKKVAYRVGTTLHKRYNSFLGPTWNIQYTEARSTDVNRTKMSLQLVLAGLWPPTGNQIINPSLNWQPIPFETYPNDKVLPLDQVCKNFKTMREEVENSVEIQQALSVYDAYWEYLSNVTGDNVTTLMNGFDIYVDQISQLAYGYPLEEWVISALPILERMTKDVYYIETNTTELKKLAGGYLLKKIINDSLSMINRVTRRKMFIYSAHERNLAYFLLILGTYNDKVPAYGTHILVELHLVDEVYGFKIYHHDWSTNAPKLLTIPGCQAFCPYDEFVALFQELLPEEDLCVIS